MRGAKHVAFAAAFGSAALSPLPAVAQTSVAQSLPANVRSELARAHFRTGMQYYALSRFGEAAVEFERVFEFTGQNALLYNIARSHDLAGNFARAAETYDRYLAGISDDSSSQVVRADIERLRDRARDQSSATTRTDEPQRCAQATTAAATDTTNSTSTTSTTASGSSDAPTIDARPARTTARTTANRAAPPPLLQLRTQVVFERSAFNEVGPWLAVGVGAIAAGFGAWQSTVAIQQRAMIERAVGGDSAGWTASVDRAYAEFSTTSALAWGLSAGGGAALSAGVVWLIARGRGTRREVVVAAAPQFNGAQVTIGGRF